MDTGKPSEFGGKVQPNGFQPEDPAEAISPGGLPAPDGHDLTSSELLSLIYGTGQEEDTTAPRHKAAIRGNGPPETWERNQ